ncbi:MAG: glutamate--tRNA ligase [Hyphomonadaceae bacterium]|nr:glutamate--tRNA ligase [Hyphomonadaceae bacterium]
MSTPKVITRFAPSPTGYLHIGGARTALFSYYFAKRHNGEFRLRIEDTDKVRSTEAATQAILDGMDWLGIHHDGDIVYQSKREQRHRDVAEELVNIGAAYHCYMTDNEVAAERELSRAEGRAFRSPYRDHRVFPTPGAEPKSTPYVTRFRVSEGETIVQDEVLGEVKWDNKDFDDLILLRTDGTPVYMLAVVADDHDMGVTHVIRGDDHLTNAGRQQQIYNALGWDVPAWSHVPLIFGPDGKKLSKRHGALGIDAYAARGYIPAGLRNYLTRLGWSHGDMEVFDDAEVTKIFELSDINKAPARLDFDKMAFVNGEHLQRTSAEEILERGRKFFEEKNEGPLNDEQMSRLEPAIQHLTTRANTLIEFAEQAYFVTRERPVEITGKTKKQLKPDAEKYLEDLHSALQAVKEAEWKAEQLSGQLKTYCEIHELGFGKIGAPLRASLTGGAPSPDLAIVLELLGKAETLGRIQDCLSTYY